MTIELETWLLDVGDVIIRKQAEDEANPLSESEHAVYWMWLIDYAVRNSGSFGPLEDSGSAALIKLATFARKAQLSVLTSWLEQSSSEEAFCSNYYERFDEGCAELKTFYERSAALAGS